MAATTVKSPASNLSASNPPAKPSVNPIQFTPLKLSDLQSDSGVAFLNNMLAQVQTQLNQLIGAAGPTPLPSGANLGGSPINNLGEPTSPSDAISKAHAEANYSAAALAPQLESGGAHSLKTVRWLNSKSQQESYSTFLNRVTNTAPTTNTTVVTAGSPSGDNVTITIPAGYHQFVDGSIIPFTTFTDTVPLPSSFTVTTIVRASGVVTASGTFSGLVAGDSIYYSGGSDTSFTGNFTLITASGTQLTWAQPSFADGSGTAGIVLTSGVFYFYLKYPSQTLAVSGPFAADSQLNRLNANADGQTLVAVAVINGSGLVTTESAGGATVPAATNGNRILTRL